MRYLAASLAAAMVLCATCASAVDVRMGYLRQEIDHPPTLSNLDPVPDDDGLAGARVALEDNSSTGRFLNQTFALNVISVPPGGALLDAARTALADTQLLVLDMPAADLIAVADLPEARGAILMNVSAGDVALRQADCRANLLHVAPSDAMRTDALAQFLVRKRWTDVAMVTGTKPADLSFAAAMRHSLTKFQLKLRDEKAWDDKADMRRSAAQEIPPFTQTLKEHDVLIVADETDDFARYIAYNTWEPRPIAGSDGLRPRTWAPVVEQWGAAQLQSRFQGAAGRDMRPRDYAAWAAIRAIGEAVTRTNAADPATLRAYLLSDDFELAGFKGRPLSFRPWNGQLRQPIPLVTDRAVVAMAPLDGFLHPVSELDTLGQDAPESTCTVFED
ncbi:ABC transporter substrate-binding protein [Aliiroseovarius sp. PTFE2010]|uniref:ABC transporter substrate-binding protein n=1 Tax=Aliiroseovarius sp. PTFE2010 TaxID=3417190 RepID=UPI003CF5D705